AQHRGQSQEARDQGHRPGYRQRTDHRRLPRRTRLRVRGEHRPPEHVEPSRVGPPVGRPGGARGGGGGTASSARQREERRMTGESVSAGERIRGRLIGTEIEFGIVAVDEPGLSSVVTSTQAVRAYSEPGAASGGEAWDYGSETPLRDARGYALGRARPTSAVDPGEFGITNRILVNGARFYVDHAHPEYSAPEVDTPLDAVIWDKAGERIMHRAGRASSAIPDHP